MFLIMIVMIILLLLPPTRLRLGNEPVSVIVTILLIFMILDLLRII